MSEHETLARFMVPICRALLRAEKAANIGGKIMMGTGSEMALEDPIGGDDSQYLMALSTAKHVVARADQGNGRQSVQENGRPANEP